MFIEAIIIIFAGLLMIYAVFFLFGLFCVWITKDKKALKEYFIFAPSLLWILPLAALRVVYKILRSKE